jgi:hypothetical protein
MVALVAGFFGGFGAMGLLGGECANCDQHGRIDCMGLIKESTEDFLEMLGVGQIEWLRGVWWQCVLSVCAIGGFLPDVGRCFRSGWLLMLELLHCMFNVSRHGYFAGVGVVVPF